MFEYTVIVMICLALAFISFIKITSMQRETKFLLVVVLIVAFFVGVRDMIGGYDIYLYRYFFDASSTLSTKGYSIHFGFEPLYTFYNFIVKSIWNDFNFFLLTTSFISYFLIYRSIKGLEYAGFIFFIIVAKFLLVSFIYLRQFMSLGLVWVAFRCLEKEKTLPFFLITFAASLFHHSAFLAFIIFPFRKRTISKLATIVILLSSFVLGQVNILKEVAVLLGQLTGNLKLISYGNIAATESHIFYLLETFLLSLLLFIVYKKVKYVASPIYLNLFVLYLSMTLLTLKDPGLLRLQWVFFIGFAVTFPLIIKAIKIPDLKVIIALLFLSYYTAYYYRGIVLRDSGDFIPYKAFFQDKKRESQFSDL